MNLIFVEYFVVEFVVLIDDCVRYRRISSFGIGPKILFKNYQELSVLHVDEEIIGGLMLILHLS